LQWWHGNLSLKDFIADLLGTAAATAAIVIICWRLRRPAAGTAAAAGGGGGKAGGAKYQPVLTEDIELGIRSKE
jgi:hypothetical protein